MTPSSLRAALYARVSSQQQAEANTIGSQVEALQARIRADGLRVSAECCFLDEGYSGSTLLRPALERLRDQAAAGALDKLYVHSPDRLSRSYPCQGSSAMTPDRCCSSRSSSDTTSRSSSSTTTSAGPPRRTCC